MSINQLLPFHDDHPNHDDLQAYIDQVLEQPVNKIMEDHLKTCSACQDEIGRLESVILQLETLPEIPINRDYSTSVKKMIQGNKQVPRGLTWTLLIEGVAAGVVLGLIIPAIQASVWTPRFLEIQHEFRAAINIFLTQFASNWIFWWEKIQFDFTQISKSLNTSVILPWGLPSPWILIMVGVGAGILTNIILLRSSFQFRNNGTNS